MQPFQSKNSATLFLILSFALLVTLTTTLYASATPLTIYWHATNDGLPLDVQALAVAPPATLGEAPTLYAGLWGDGVYRSTDHGATWLAATAGLTLPLYVRGGLAVNPVTPTTLYAGDYYGKLSNTGVYRSTNGGDSWALVLADVGVETLLVHPLAPNLVLAGTVEDGLQRSADGGDSWASVGLPAQRVQTLAAAPVVPGPIYAGAGRDLYLNANGDGASWALASTLSSTVESLAVHPVTPTLLYAGTRQHGLGRSANGGTTWTWEADGLPGNAWVTSIALHPITPTILYAGTWQGQVYRSIDGGDTWEGLGYLGYVYDVPIHPTALSVLYAATSNNGVFRGSTLHHLTMASVDSPQYVDNAFPLTVTARDEIGFPLTGPTQAQLAALTVHDSALAETLAAGGFDGTATLTDTTGTIRPLEITFADGMAMEDVMIAATVNSGTITVTVPGGPAVTSNPFDVISFKVYLPVVVRND